MNDRLVFLSRGVSFLVTFAHQLTWTDKAVKMKKIEMEDVLSFMCLLFLYFIFLFVFGVACELFLAWRGSLAPELVLPELSLIFGFVFIVLALGVHFVSIFCIVVST